MKEMNTLHKYASLFLAVVLIVFTAVVPVSNAEDVDLYVYHRDGNGESLYLYQSPCMLGYDIDNQYGGNGVPIQAFLYTMYNTQTGEHFPTYCTDIHTTAVRGAYYRRMNLEDSPFAASAAGKIRAILNNGFYIIPIAGESDSAHAARVKAKTEKLGAAAGVDNLTTGEAIAATQAAIWQAAHGSRLSFPNFCRSIFKPTNTKYVSLCSYQDVNAKGKAAAAETIEKVYNYLLSLSPVGASSNVVSHSSFKRMENQVTTDNGNGTSTVSVDVTVDVDMASGDSLMLSAYLGGRFSEQVALVDGKQTNKLTIHNVPAENVSDDIKLLVSGSQTVSGFFFFEAEGGRDAAQAMVAYDSSSQPVYTELTAKPKVNPDPPGVTTGGINLLKVDGADQTPLAGASFVVYRPATAEEINANSENLTEISGVEAKMVQVSFYDNAELKGDKVTSATSGDDGKIAIYGLPYGSYYLVETEAPAGYNLLAEPKEITIDATSHTEGNMIIVENMRGALLPATGGVGTMVYTVSGMAFICIAGLFLYKNKRNMKRT